MAAKKIAFEPLRTSLRNRKFSPVYVLQGEEGYFIDTLVKDFEDILPDDEKEFNLNILYAPRVDLEQLPEICRRVPMFSDFQIVILKEAQSVRADALNVLIKYISNVSPSTILVVAARGALLKGDFIAAAKKSDNVVLFETKKIYENELPAYIESFVKSRGLNIEPKATSMLCEYIGVDLSKLYNEIDKLIGILGPGATVTPEAIEKHVGFSKSFNAYELIDALAAKNAKKAFRIAAYFRANPKAEPLVKVSAAIFDFFSNLLITYFAKDKSDRALMALLGVKNNFHFRRYNDGRRCYNAFQVIEIIRSIRAFDRHSKGSGSRRYDQDLFQELIYHILTARGNLFPSF